MSIQLENLLKWNKEIEITAGEAKKKVFIRIIGDMDYQIAQRTALLASREFRKELKDPNSDYRKTLSFDLEEAGKSDIINNIVLAEVTKIRDSALENLIEPKQLPDLGDNPTLEDREKQLEAKDAQIVERQAELEKLMLESSEDRKKELKPKKLGELKDIFVESIVTSKCMEEFYSVFREYCAFAGTYTDGRFKTREFSSFDAFRNSSPSIKSQMLSAYEELEKSGSDLKN